MVSTLTVLVISLFSICVANLFFSGWVYRDVQKYDPMNTRYWFFVTLGTGPVGFYLYLRNGRDQHDGGW